MPRDPDAPLRPPVTFPWPAGDPLDEFIRYPSGGGEQRPPPPPVDAQPEQPPPPPPPVNPQIGVTELPPPNTTMPAPLPGSQFTRLIIPTEMLEGFKDEARRYADEGFDLEEYFLDNEETFDDLGLDFEEGAPGAYVYDEIVEAYERRRKEVEEREPQTFDDPIGRARERRPVADPWLLQQPPRFDSRPPRARERSPLPTALGFRGPSGIPGIGGPRPGTPLPPDTTRQDRSRRSSFPQNMRLPRDVPQIYRPGERIRSDPRMPSAAEILRQMRERAKPRTRKIDPIPLPQLEPKRPPARPPTPVRTIPDPVFPEFPAPSVEPRPQREPPAPNIPAPMPTLPAPPPITRPAPRTTPPRPRTIPRRITVPQTFPVPWPVARPAPGVSPIRRVRPGDFLEQPLENVPRVVRETAPPAIKRLPDLTPVQDPVLPFLQPARADTGVRRKQDDEECKCDEPEEPKPKRPSNVLAKVRSFTRRMSRNSLDNLR